MSKGIKLFQKRHTGRKKINVGLCIVKDCLNQQVKRHYCEKHYRRWQKHGDPLFIKKVKVWNKGKKGVFRHTDEFKKERRDRWLGKNNPRWKGNIIEAICDVCGKVFLVYPSRIKDGRGKHCSRKCFEKYHRENQRGNNSHFWKGGITLLYNMLRGLPEYKLWRKKVYKRDNHTCQKCGNSKSGSLNAHHKKSFSEILAKFLKEYDQFSPTEDKETLVRLAIKYQPFWDIGNGVTLCVDCHKLTNSYFHSHSKKT